MVFFCLNIAFVVSGPLGNGVDRVERMRFLVFAVAEAPIGSRAGRLCPAFALVARRWGGGNLDLLSVIRSSSKYAATYHIALVVHLELPANRKTVKHVWITRTQTTSSAVLTFGLLFASKTANSLGDTKRHDDDGVLWGFLESNVYRVVV